MTEPAVQKKGFRFSQVPEALTYSDISGRAHKIYAALLRHGDDPANCYPSNERLAELCHMSIRTARRATAELEEAGWIVKVQRFNHRQQTSNGYDIYETPVEARPVKSDHPSDEQRRPVKSDPPTPVKSGHPTRSNLATKREPVNESQSNETELNSSSTATARPTPTIEDDDGGRNREWMAHALEAIGAKEPCPNTVQCMSVYNALVAGVDVDALNDILDRCIVRASAGGVAYPELYLYRALVTATEAATVGAANPIDLGFDDVDAEYWARQGVKP